MPTVVANSVLSQHYFVLFLYSVFERWRHCDWSSARFLGLWHHQFLICLASRMDY